MQLVDELLGPALHREAAAEVAVVDHDLSLPTGEHRGSVLDEAAHRAALDAPAPGLELGGDRLEATRAAGDVADQHRVASPGAGLDLLDPALSAAFVLLGVLTPAGRVEASRDRVCVAGQVAQEVSDAPALEQARFRRISLARQVIE